MNYVNNWSRPVTLAIGATALELDLPDGEYRLTLTDSAAEPTRWEIIDAVVTSGTATLARQQEGTLEQSWPAGSTIFNAVTAGTLIQMDSRIAAIEEGGGAGAIIAGSPPGETDMPTAVGAFYSVPGMGLWVSNGTEFGSDWMVLSGLMRSGFIYNSGFPGGSYSVAYPARNLRVEVDGPFSGTFPATLIMPWTGQPYGLSIEILPREATAFALSLDFSLMGAQAYAAIENRGVVSASASAEGSIVTVTVGEACLLKLVSVLRDGEFFDLEFQLEPITPSTYLSTDG